MRRGTIVLVPFPFTDLSGHKVRPALILSDSRKGEDCIVAFISSNLKEKESVSVLIAPTHSNGLKNHSLVVIDKLATLQKKVVLGELGRLESFYLKEVTKKLKVLFRL